MFEFIGRAFSKLASRKASQRGGVRESSWGLEEVLTQVWLLTNRCENGHGIFPTLASMFGRCSEQQLDDLLGTWLHPSQNASQASGVRGRSWCLEEVLTQLWLLMNACENRCNAFPTLLSMFEGHSEGQFDDLLGLQCQVKKQAWELG
jgi:hypothetical protein